MVLKIASSILITLTLNKSKNPFAYFTQIVFYAYLRRIAKEKRQLDIKEKLIEKKGYDEVFHSDSNDNHSDMNSIKNRVETNMRN